MVSPPLCAHALPHDLVTMPAGPKPKFEGVRLSVSQESGLLDVWCRRIGMLLVWSLLIVSVGSAQLLLAVSSAAYHGFQLAVSDMCGN